MNRSDYPDHRTQEQKNFERDLLGQNKGLEMAALIVEADQGLSIAARRDIAASIRAEKHDIRGKGDDGWLRPRSAAAANGSARRK